MQSPTQLDRTGAHNCVIEHYTEFDLKTDEEFDAYIETAKEGGEVQATEENTGEAVPAEAGEDEAYISFRTKEEQSLLLF